jgi:hypothetical protein
MTDDLRVALQSLSRPRGMDILIDAGVAMWAVRGG